MLSNVQNIRYKTYAITAPVFRNTLAHAYISCVRVCVFVCLMHITHTCMLIPARIYDYICVCVYTYAKVRHLACVFQCKSSCYAQFFF
jgi:hypothetical protein